MITDFEQTPETGAIRSGSSASRTGIRLSGYAIALLAALLTGCTSLQPVADDPGKLQENIRAGTTVQKGDKARIVTRDGVSHRLVVTAVQEDTLQGQAQGRRTGSVRYEIPVSDIIALEKEQASAGGSAVHTLGTLMIVFTLMILGGAIGLL